MKHKRTTLIILLSTIHHITDVYIYSFSDNYLRFAQLITNNYSLTITYI